MEALIGPLMSILGKYALDQGASLLADAGQGARDAAGRLFAKVMDRLKADPAEARNAERFASNPEGYQAVLDVPSYKATRLAIEEANGAGGAAWAAGVPDRRAS